TTNYDTLTEKALSEAGRQYDVVVRKYGDNSCKQVPSKDLRKKVDPESRTLIYKMHGSADTTTDWNSLVITEEDHVDFLSRMNSFPPAIPPVFTEHISSRSFLFLGYGLGDWNSRVIVKNLLPKRTPKP